MNEGKRLLREARDCPLDYMPGESLEERAKRMMRYWPRRSRWLMRYINDGKEWITPNYYTRDEVFHLLGSLPVGQIKVER